MVVLYHCSSFSINTNVLDPKTQPQFVNPLPVPSVIDGRNGGLFTVAFLVR
jgi:hypothetical protein